MPQRYLAKISTEFPLGVSRRDEKWEINYSTDGKGRHMELFAKRLTDRKVFPIYSGRRGVVMNLLANGIPCETGTIRYELFAGLARQGKARLVKAERDEDAPF